MDFKHIMCIPVTLKNTGFRRVEVVDKQEMPHSIMFKNALNIGMSNPSIVQKDYLDTLTDFHKGHALHAQVWELYRYP